jgi:catechol 2,3-dioxygenase-like lactoylglutathione lyase family enzyme
MEARVSLITLGVQNLERSLKFYTALGLPTTWTPDKGVIFFKTSGTVLALYPLDKLAEDIGEHIKAVPSKFAGITLAHNVKKKEEVDQVMKQALDAGAKIEKPAKDAFWGGYSGYFSDPDGYMWEVAWGAFPFKADGSLDIP